MSSVGDSDSESESRPHKRQRLSSPTYDEQFEMFTQEEVKAVEMFEQQLSQASAAAPKLAQPPSQVPIRPSGFTSAASLQQQFTPVKFLRDISGPIPALTIDLICQLNKR